MPPTDDLEFQYAVKLTYWQWSPLIEASSGNLALLHCSCLHACLAAYSNILRRDLNTMCITINRGMWRHSRGPIRGGLINTWRLLKQAFSKSWDKNHIKGGQAVSCSTEYEQSYCELTRRSFQSVRSYEEIHGTFDSKGGRRPQRSISTTVDGDCSTSHLR